MTQAGVISIPVAQREVIPQNYAFYFRMSMWVQCSLPLQGFFNAFVYMRPRYRDIVTTEGENGPMRRLSSWSRHISGSFRRAKSASSRRLQAHDDVVDEMGQQQQQQQQQNPTTSKQSDDGQPPQQPHMLPPSAWSPRQSLADLAAMSEVFGLQQQQPATEPCSDEALPQLPSSFSSRDAELEPVSEPTSY